MCDKNGRSVPAVLQYKKYISFFLDFDTWYTFRDYTLSMFI